MFSPHKHTFSHTYITAALKSQRLHIHISAHTSYSIATLTQTLTTPAESLLHFHVVLTLDNKHLTELVLRILLES